MASATRIVLVLLIVVVTGAVWSARSGVAPGAAPGPPPNASGTFGFASGTPGERQAFLTAVAGARPEARALIDRVDALATIEMMPTGPKAAGYARREGGRYTVVVDLAATSARYGQRGIDRLVLHELGHVVDGLLVDEGLAATLDAGIPRGWGCDQGTAGACANQAERFADTFAKWATDDIGVDLYLGYKVPPPLPSLEAWGGPLSALRRR